MYKHTYITLQPILSPRPPTFSHFCIIYPCLYIFFFLTLPFFVQIQLKIANTNLFHQSFDFFNICSKKNIKCSNKYFKSIDVEFVSFSFHWYLNSLSRWHFRWGRNRMKGHDIWQLWHLWGRGRCIAWSQ